MENISKLTPILYEKNETNFNHNGLGKLTNLLVNEIDEGLNGEFEAFFEYPANGRLADKVDYEMFIKAKPNKKDDPHVFKVYDYDLDTFSQTYLIYARSKNIEDLRTNVILDVNARDLTPTQAWNLAKNNALDSVVTTFYSDITTPSSVHWERRSLLSIIAGEQGSMIQYWGGEIKHGIDWVGLYRRRGQDNVTTVRHGKNLDGLKATYSTKGLVTAIVPYYIKDEDNAVYGDVVKSQYINNYPNTYYDIVEYSDEDLGLNSEDEPDNNDILNALNSKASRWFDKHPEKDLPSINMEIALEDISQTKEYELFKDFEQIELGDTITVYSRKFNVNITAKVRRVVYNGLTDKNEIVEVGTVRRGLYDDVREDFKNDINRVENQLQEGIDHAMASANGKNTNYHGTADPNEVGLVGKDGDNYFRENGQLKELWIYRDGMWHLEVGDLTGEQIRAEIAEQQEDIAEAQATADNAITEISTAIDAAGFDTLADSLTGIQSISKTAQNNSIEALGTAQDSMNTAMSAINSATEAITEIENIDIRVDEVEGSLSIKADKQVVDALAGIVDTHTTDIQVNAQGLALKANQSTVDTLAGTVSSLGTEFDVVAGQVSSRVWNTDIETAIDGIEVGGRNLLPTAFNLYSTEGTYGHIRILDEDEKIILKLYEEDDSVDMSGIYFGFTRNGHSSGDGVKWAMIGGSLSSNLNDNLEMVGNNHQFFSYFPNNRETFDKIFSHFKIKIERGTKATDWTPAPEDTLARFDHIETEWTQTFDTFSQHVSSIDGRVTAQKQTIDSISNTVADNTGRIASQQLTIDGLQTEVYDPETGLTSVNTQLANLVNIAVTGDELSGALSVLEDNLNLRLVAKDEVITQINLSDENILIQSNKILLDGNVTVSGTAWLPGAVIADASIDTAQIADLAVSSAKISSLDVSKLSGNHMEFITGAFSASNGDISITGRQIQINSIDYANMRLNRNNVEFSRSDGIIVGGLVATHNPDNPSGPIGLSLVTARSGQYAGIGRHIGSGRHLPSFVAHGTTGDLRAYNSITMVSGTSLRLAGGGYVTSENQNIIVRNNTSNAVRIDTGVSGGANATRASFSEFGIYFYENVNLNSKNVLNVATIDDVNRLTNIGSIEALWYRGPRNEQVYFGVNRDGSSVTSFRLQHDGMRMYQSVNWNGNNLHAVGSINYASDARLKEIIGTRTEDDLATIMAINYKNYYRSGSKERGFIAQELQLIDSDLITVGENGMLGYDGQGYVHTIGHAVQILGFREQNTNQVASQALQLGESNEEKIKRLEKRIEELESAA